MIHPPPLLLGAGAVFWGLYCDQLVLSLAVAVMLEGASVVKFRLDLTEADFRRVLVFSALGLIAVTVYLLAMCSVRGAILELLQWLPLIALPMLAAQRYASSDSLNWRNLLPVRASTDSDPHRKLTTGALGYPYLALCLIAASAANERSLWFYMACMLICGWGLWIVRSRCFSPYTWGGMFLLAAVLGHSVHVSLNHLQHYLMDATVDLLVGEGMYTDPYRSTTRLGYLGTLKLSDRILIRIYPESRFTAPLLLHRASYDRYLYGEWIAKDANLRHMTSDLGGQVWTFERQSIPSKKIVISEYLDRGAAVLSLPSGTLQLRHLPVAELQRNRLGTVQVKDEEKPVIYEALYDPALSTEADPSEYDLSVPKDDLETLSGIASDLGARTLSAVELLKNVETFFAENFAYSLSQQVPVSVENALRDFLTKTRYGHCEYFATATVLLLRAAGIPARYATGYSVQEYSGMEQAYVVRLRHAHAWARAYVDGKWVDLDTTPTVWADVEQDNASLWQPLLDVVSWLWFRYTGWRFQEGGDLSEYLYIALVILAIGSLAWWLRRKRHKPEQYSGTSQSEPQRRWPGSDSEFRLIEQRLIREGLERKRGEPLYIWIQRVSLSETIPIDGPCLVDIAALHYRYRFAPEGIDQTHRKALADGVREWLRHYEKGDKTQEI